MAAGEFDGVKAAEAPADEGDGFTRLAGEAEETGFQFLEPAGPQEGKSYGMPALKVAGKPLISVIATKTHLSLFPFSGEIVERVADRLPGFSLSKGTIRFQVDQPLPDDVIRDIVRARLAQIGA